MEHPTYREYVQEEWLSRLDGDTHEEWHVATVSVTTDYLVYQLNTGDVIIVTNRPTLRYAGDNPWMLMGEPMPYTDALRLLADMIDEIDQDVDPDAGLVIP